MKKIITTLLIFLSIGSFAQDKRCDSITWKKEYRLTWTDFKAIPDTAIKDLAQSAVRLHKKWKLTGDTLSINISAYFMPCRSWSKAKSSDTLLMHEQGHFNIAEYFRRMMLKRMTEQHFKRKSINPDIQAIFLDVSAAEKTFNELYESKTEHGRNYNAQKEWLAKIDSLIESLADYNMPAYVTTVSE